MEFPTVAHCTDTSNSPFMPARQRADRWPLPAAIALVGLILSPLLFGLAPLVGDPELMYQPIKTELARALSSGRLPFWSDRFGLGVPLAAESHAAAFHPLNWVFYRLWDVPTASRLALWLHSLALVATTFAYARILGIGAAGSALAAVTFALCGFQAIHAVHEPFFQAMPYLPLCLLLADRYAVTGRRAWLAGLAVCWGAQLLLGHFQIQMWTAGLSLLTGCFRVVVCDRAMAGKIGRMLGLAAGLAWGAMIGWIQLRLTWELSRVAGFDRPSHFLTNYLFPPGHWAQFVLPELYLANSFSDASGYWGRLGAAPWEACGYVGVVPLVVAFVGLVAAPRDRALTIWRLTVPLSLGLATMPGWWPDGYLALLELPGLGWFRAPSRYTLLTSLGLALLAGRGLERAIVPRRFWLGIALAVFVGVLGWGWSIHWAARSDFQAGLGPNTIAARFASSGMAWLLAVAAIVAWRLKVLPSWAPVGVAVVELGVLFFLGPVNWVRTIRLPDESPVLQRLAALKDHGLVAGRLSNLPVHAGCATAYPNLGIIPPPPNYLLEAATEPPAGRTEAERRWQRRFGVAYGVWGSQDDVRGTELLAEIADPALDRVMSGVFEWKRGGLGPWKLVRMRDPFPSAWIAPRIREARSWGQLYSELSGKDARDEAYILAEDFPSALPEPFAEHVSLKSWDGNTAIVEHDGSCILVVRRTYYPGWTYRISDGKAGPVLKVNGGLQGIPLAGSSTSRVTLVYRPTGLFSAIAIALGALAAAMAVGGLAALKSIRWTSIWPSISPM
jgi:hypothetical protein